MITSTQVNDSSRGGGTSTLLFIGDSVTESGRFQDQAGLGTGYVRIIADAFERERPSTTVINRGVGGNRAKDLAARWQTDCLALEPDAVSVAVGINDTWRRYDSADPTSDADFESIYRQLLQPLADRAVQLILVEPFLLPISEEQQSWREDLDGKIDVVHRLAERFSATLVRADSSLNGLAGQVGASALAPDGVHPSDHGHEFLAGIWRDSVTAARLPIGVR